MAKIQKSNSKNVYVKNREFFKQGLKIKKKHSSLKIIIGGFVVFFPISSATYITGIISYFNNFY